MTFTKARGMQRAAGWKRILCCASLQCAATISVEIAAAVEPAVVGQLSMTCSASTVSGTYKSLSSDYVVTGTCLLFETSSRGGTAQLNIAVNWTAQASHQPNTKATFETMTLALTEFGKTTTTGAVTSTMQCGSDPWRLTPGGPCRLVTRKTSPPSFPGYVSMAYQQLLQDAPNLPLSFKLNPTQRVALDKQYQIAMAAQQPFDPSHPTLSKPQGPGGSAFTPGVPKTSDAILSRQMPRILSPASGATVVVGQLLVTIQPPLIGKEPVAELEFAWLDTPAGQPRFVNTIPAMDTATLLQGQYIDPKVTRLNYGRWEMRVRMIGQGATAGPWSAPALFNLVPAQSNQSIQTPSPASPFLKNPSERFGAGTTVIRPRGFERETNAERDSPTRRAEPGASK